MPSRCQRRRREAANESDVPELARGLGHHSEWSVNRDIQCEFAKWLYGRDLHGFVVEDVSMFAAALFEKFTERKRASSDGEAMRPLKWRWLRRGALHLLARTHSDASMKKVFVQ